MTDKIKSAISEIENMRKFNYTLAPNEVFDLAIHSLEAWEEVLTELEEKTDFADCCCDMEEKLGIKSAINIINQKLKYVKKEG